MVFNSIIYNPKGLIGMPINIPDSLPASKILKAENIFVIDDKRAITQDIRPLDIAILNIMPTKIATETQLLRMLSNTPLQLNITFLHPASHDSKNTAQEHLDAFYHTFDQVRDRKFDGFIMTGAPVEKMRFEDVDYWQELCEIMEWSKTHVYSTLHICWGAQAGLYYHYGVKKYQFEDKISGIYKNRILDKRDSLFRGMDDKFYMPHSRYTEVRAQDISRVDKLQILAESDEIGVSIVCSKDHRQLFFLGHGEYDRNTLHDEYMRDLQKGLDIEPPEHYYPDNNIEQKPELYWRSHASLLYLNWLNYYVYQSTPYNIDEIQ